MRWYN